MTEICEFHQEIKQATGNSSMACSKCQRIQEELAWDRYVDATFHPWNGYDALPSILSV